MKKLLVASAAVAVAAPAFANDVTLSGNVVGELSTSNLNTVTAGALSTFEITLAVAPEGNGIGGNITFGLEQVLTTAPVAGVPGTTTLATVEDYSFGVTGYDIFAMTDLGKFNVGTSTTTKTDDDLTEMNAIGDTGEVDFASGLIGFDEGFHIGSYLSYSNDLGPISVGLTWGAAADALGNAAGSTYVLSLGADLGGFAALLDYAESGDYVLTLEGSVGGFGVALETDQDGDADAKFSGSFGDFGVALGVNTADDVELEVTGAVGDMSFHVYAGEVGGNELSGIGFSTMIAGMEVGADYDSRIGSTGPEGSVYIKPIDGFKISTDGEGLTFAIDMGF